jgi:hypothetical protein
MTEKHPSHDRILAAAFDLARERGWPGGITRNGTAERAGVADGLVNWAFGTTANLREAVMAQAVAQGELDIVAQGIAAGSEAARAAPHDMKVKALATMLS